MKRILTLISVLSALTLQGQVGPLLESEWGQKAPYNNSCPQGTVTGCGPLAIGQILYYYRQPEHGYGVKTYHATNLDTDITIDYSTMTFDWANVLPNYAGTYNSIQARAVADIVYQIGVAMEANYDSSTSINNYAKSLYGMQTYLHISPDSRYRKRKFYSTPEWLEMINRDLEAGRPVYYRGDWKFNGETSGHIFVVDGIDADGNYHFNLGHNGSNDKFTDINVINQSGIAPGNRGVCYNYAQAAVFDCYPTPDCDSYLSQACLLDEPIVLNENMDLRTITVPLGEKFSLGAVLRNVCDQKVTITYSWGLTKDGEEPTKYFNNSTYGLSGGHKFDGYRHREVYIPAGTEDGNYNLYIYWKSDMTGNKWHRVWDNAPNKVDVVVANGKATITVPDSHAGDPLIEAAKNITEVDILSPNTVPGRSFEIELVNSTSNNYEGPLKLVLTVADNTRSTQTIEYTTDIALYSNTTVPHHILVPTSAINLNNKTITDVKAYYTYRDEEKLIAVQNNTTTGIEAVDITDGNDTLAPIIYYDLNGAQVQADALRPGVYIRRQGANTSKIIIR
ncbi:MAG: C10 family peptidase [Muribaculaceae bacterium]|nr:C10 family peptidase [Muribaculaceae bacterium]